MKKFVALLILLTTVAHAGPSTFIQGPALIESLGLVVTAAGTTTLTPSSETYQEFTGSTTQTVVLPDATTLKVGRKFVILNSSTGSVDVQDNTIFSLAMVGTDSAASLILYDNSTAAGLWASMSSGGGGLGYTPEDVANKSNDVTMAADSTTLYPTQHAAKTYADTSSASAASGKVDKAGDTMSGALTMAELATPATPASGFVSIYPKADHYWYGLDSLGVETQLSNVGGGGSLLYQIDGPNQSVIEGNVGSNTAAGLYAHAEGTATTASGAQAHAEGFTTQATGSRSHAEGSSSVASGTASHSEGNSTASNTAAHAEGLTTTASGANSHSEGTSTVASGASAHSEGNSSLASGPTSHAQNTGQATGDRSSAAGEHTTAQGFAQFTIGAYNIIQGTGTYHSTPTGDDAFIIGNGNVGTPSNAFKVVDTGEVWLYNLLSGLQISTPATPASGRTLLYPKSDDNWYQLDDAGNEKKLSTIIYQKDGPNQSVIEGDVGANSAAGLYAHSEGGPNDAGGDKSHAEGQFNSSSGTASHAEGSGTLASGSTAHAEGDSSVASGNTSHAEGNTSTATADSSHAEGDNGIAAGASSHVEGSGSSTSSGGSSAHAEGFATQANGTRSHSEGSNTTASGAQAHAEGQNTVAANTNSHAEGNATQATNTGCHVEGHGTSGKGCSGTYAHAEGTFTLASGSNSHAEGGSTTASGGASHAEGTNTVASGDFSHAAGEGTTSQAYASLAVGRFNLLQGTSGSFVSGDDAFVIGNGTAIGSEHNAFSVLNDGTVNYFGLTSGKLSFQANAVTTDYTLIWPAAQGAAGTVPTNDGAGNLSWASPGASAITGLTGDVTATGPGSVPATIAVGAVTDTKGSLSNKPASTVVATTNQALTGTPTIDGQATASGSVILLTAQTSGAENGPWVAAAGAWNRPTWYPSGGTTQAFRFITTLIRLGSTYQGSVWRMTTAGAITIDTTATTWVVTPLAVNASTVTGTLPIANGGTGQTSASAAFDGLSPMTTQYDLIIGGASGTGTRLPKGANGTHLTTQGGVVAWTSDPTPYVISTVSSNTSAACGTTYLADTSGGAFTITLPAPVSGCYVGIVDATGTFDTNNLTLAPNGGEKIVYVAASKVLSTFGYSHIFFTQGTDWFQQ